MKDLTFPFTQKLHDFQDAIDMRRKQDTEGEEKIIASREVQHCVKRVQLVTPTTK